MPFDPSTLGLGALEDQYQLPSGLLAAVAKQESNFNPNAVSPAGARGLFQFMPETAKQYGIDPNDPQQSAQGAARMYADLLKQNKGDLNRALAGYNWGQGNLQRKGLENAPPETRNYISSITNRMGQQQPQVAQKAPQQPMPQQVASAAPQRSGFEKFMDAAQNMIIPQAHAEEMDDFEGTASPVETAPAPDDDFEGTASEVQQDGDFQDATPEAVVPDRSRLEEDARRFGLGTRNVIEGTAALPALALDPAIALSNAIRAKYGIDAEKQYPSFSKSVDEFLTKIGLPKPENDTEENIGTAIELLTPTGGGIAKAPEEAALLAKPVADYTLKGAQTFGRGTFARSSEQLDEAANAIKSASNAGYKEMRDLGAVLNPTSAAQIPNKIDEALAKMGKNNAALHGDTLSVLSDLKDAVKKGPLSLEELDQYRQLLREVTNKHFDLRKGMGADGAKAQAAINALDKVVDTFSAKDLASGDEKAIGALNKGRDLWSKYRKFDTIADIVKKSGGDPNRLKAALNRLYSSRKSSGFTNEELQYLKKAANLGPIEYMSKALGKFGFDLGSPLAVGNTLLPALGMAGEVSHHGTGPIVAAGTVARQIHKSLARGKAEDLLRMIEENALPKVKSPRARQ